LLLQFYVAHKVLVGNDNIVHAYAYHAPFLISQHIKFSGNLSSAHQTHEKIFDRGDLVVKSQRSIVGADVANLARKSLTGKYDALLIILHNLIQKRVAYFGNLSLAAGDREAKVAFDLLPNGEVEQVEIQHSSGLKFFDKLAKQAVREIQPVKAADHFLHNKQHFVVNVEFAA
jgi:TonB family protein